MDLALVDIQTGRQGAQRQLRFARYGIGALARKQCAVGRDRHTGGLAEGALKCGVAARELPRIEIREPEQVFIIGRLVREQMGDPEVHAAAARKELISNTSLEGIGVRLRGSVLRCKSNIDLHRAARANGIETCEQPVPQRHRADEVLVDVGEILLGPRCVDPTTVRFAIRGLQLQCRMHQRGRHARPPRTAVDLAPRDGSEPGDHGIDVETRFLLDHGDHCAD